MTLIQPGQEGLPQYQPQPQQYDVPQPAYFVQQPRIPQVAVQNIIIEQCKPKRTYHHSLMNCCSGGCGVCIAGFCCPGLLFASAKTKYDGSNFCLNACCISEIAIRNIVREGYNIKGTCCDDCIIVCCCPQCAAIQTYAEIRQRGPSRQQM
jgi:Cys-rich protein (TIGR01571 family)